MCATDDRMLHVFGGPIASRRGDVVATRPHIHRTAGQLEVVAAQRIQDVVRRETKRRHASQIERHLHFARRCGPSFCVLHAVHARQRVLEPLGHVIQLGIRHRRRHERQLKDSEIGVLVPLHLQTLQRGGQIGPQCVDLSQHLIVRAIRIDFRLELHQDDAQSIRAGGREFLHVLERIQLLFDRFRHQLFHVLRRGPRIHRDRREDRYGEVWIFGPRDGHPARDSQCGEHEKQQHGELPALHRKADEAIEGIHGAPPTTWTREPCVTYGAPRVMTRAPFSSPVTATRSPCNCAICTRCCCATSGVPGETV